jgi:hypothetical protein
LALSDQVQSHIKVLTDPTTTEVAKEAALIRLEIISQCKSIKRLVEDMLAGIFFVFKVDDYVAAHKLSTNCPIKLT